MTDTSWVIPAIKGDRTGRPWVKFGGNGLNGVDISECAFALPFWDMSDIDHVHCVDLQWKFLLSPRVRLARFVLVFALISLPLVFGVEFAGLFEDPTTMVGMVRRFSRGAMDLTGPV